MCTKNSTKYPFCDLDVNRINYLEAKVFPTGNQISPKNRVVEHWLEQPYYDHCSLFLKMLERKVLVVLVLSVVMTTFLSSGQILSGICGCPVERSISVHENRIPVRITEWKCHQPGITCGVSMERAPLSTVTNYLTQNSITFFKTSGCFSFSVNNWLDYWMLVIPGRWEN